MIHPETRNSLIARLGDAADVEAWDQFSQIYRPIIVRMGKAKGLQPADAEDLAQTVLVSISNAIERWQPNGSAKFRTWLKRIADNAILNALTRSKPDRAAGSSSVDQILHSAHRPDCPSSRLLKLEYRREKFQWAVRRIRDEFTETTWKAFWLTAVESKPAEEVGMILGRNRGSIYAARSRVMKRLLGQIQQLEEGDSNDE
jgi:RNA polymerase sigma-70 factor (ECF subfamily)